jgi:hypothetical protein
MNLNGLDCKSPTVHCGFDVIVFLTEGRQGLINWRRLLVNPVADDSDGWEKFRI